MEVKVTLCILFGMLLVHDSNALKCYFCYGVVEESGGCTFNESSRAMSQPSTMKLISCLEHDKYCYRTTYLYGGKVATGRGCGNATYCDSQMESNRRLPHYNANQKCDLCSGDYCNRGSSLIAMLYLTPILLAINTIL